MELANPQPRTYSLIRELNSNSSEWKIKVRVSRLWDVESKSKKGFKICTDMVLIDEEGGYIHSTIPGGTKLRQKLVEGNIYIIKYFDITDNKDQYRVVSDTIQEDGDIIPRHRFDFVAFHDLDRRRENFSVLSDVVGAFVDNFSTPEEPKIEIQDKCGQKVIVKLWGKCITDYHEQRRLLGEENNSFIVTITSILVKDYRGFLSLATSPASKLYINLDIDEVNELKIVLM
ncbi:uncharacterized protein LOC141617845 [Silene latifolia]|uniref:uncharacterized protein LOC141617845 n=1 Tax=Silene latifolia TaxID=37657 RepID=UPI003D77256D